LYAVRAPSFQEVDDWLDRFRGFWEQRLDSLETELARGRRARRLTPGPGPDPTPTTEAQP
jgi:hypothetical protein